MPKVTVLMPIHNQAQFLKLSLASALHQTAADLEVLVVGDGCTDQSAEVVAACPDPRVRWLGFPKAPGFGYANRERALAEARGDVIAYLAPDDLWMPHHLDSLLTELTRSGLDFIFSKPIIVRPDGGQQPHWFPFDIGATNPALPILPRLYFLSPTQALHTRDLLRRAGGWDGHLRRFGDVDVWLRCRAAGGRIAFMPQPTVLRLPSLLFRQVNPHHQERLQAELWATLRDGTFNPERGRLARPHRTSRWCQDFVHLAWVKGPSFVRARLFRRRLSSR